MKQIRILTDSASDITQQEMNNLTVLPIPITFGTQQYLDGVTLNRRDFYEKLTTQKELPITSQIIPYAFEQELERAQSRKESTIIITLSSKLSGTYHNAMTAAAQYPKTVYVVDSETAGIGEKILVQYALQLVQQGKEPEEIVATLEQLKHKICMIALLDTLEFLRRGGRISNVTGVIGSMLSIKPVIAIEQGSVVLLGKARGAKNGHNLLSEQIEKTGGINFDLPMCLGYTGLDDSLLQTYMSNNAQLWKNKLDTLPITMIGGTIGTHSGPGAIAAAFFHN